jgi:regulator of sirC expression with transglutaminase-like and TPR domain
VQQFKQAISDKDVLRSALLIAQKFNSRINVDSYCEKLTKLAMDSLSSTDPAMSQQQRFKSLLKRFYIEMAFSGNQTDNFSSKYSLLDSVIDYRCGIPVTLSIIFCHVAKLLGFDAQGVNFPGHFLLRYKVGAERILFVDPLSGNFLSWQELQSLYFSMVGDSDEQDMPIEVVAAASCEDTIIRLLHNLKAAFIKEQKFRQALDAVEFLVELCPEDPYERRDRGFLLHQLECPQVAIADYQFFIRQCPQDPGAQLLKLQLKHMHSHPPQVIH